MITSLLNGYDLLQLIRWGGYVIALYAAWRLWAYVWLDKEQ